MFYNFTTTKVPEISIAVAIIYEKSRLSFPFAATIFDQSVSWKSWNASKIVALVISWASIIVPWFGLSLRTGLYVQTCPETLEIFKYI